MKVKVIYPSDGSHEKSRIEFDVDIELVGDHEYLLEQVWLEANFVVDSDLARLQKYAKQNGVPMIRSAMVGDIFIVEDQYYICDSIGFKRVEKSFADKWCNLKSTDRSLGVKWGEVAMEKGVG